MAVRKVTRSAANAATASLLSELVDVVNDLVDAFNTHTHRGDGAQAGAYNTSKPQSDTQTVAPVTAIAAVDTLSLQ